MLHAPGVRLGTYEIVAAIGSGGMGEVYRATDSRLGRDVAIKVLPSELASDADRLRRFEQEARAAAALNHPNILAVYDVGVHNAAPYIVSELLEGQTLRERLRAGPLPIRKAVDIGVQIARGLAAAHDKAIVHRDLKPENVFVTESGLVKILDFGLAKLTQPGPASPDGSVVTHELQTKPGIVMGTVGYMAPEQVRGLPVDHRADIFAFGATLYELLAGRRAFSGETGADVLTAILREDPPGFPSGARGVPQALERIVDRCLEKTPAARFQSAGDLGFALEALSSSSDATAVTGAAGPGPRARLAWEIAGALGFFLLAVLTWVALASRAPPADEITATVFALNMPEGWSLAGAVAGPITPSSRGPLAVSPDGRQIAFVATSNERTMIWLRTLDRLSPRLLAGTEGAMSPFWSADSRHLGFFADSKLKRVEVAGGEPVVVCPIETIGIGGSWNQEGTILFSTAAAGGSRSHGLWKVSAAGGTATPASQLSPEENNHVRPIFLPDGRHFLYRALRGFETRAPVWLASLDRPERTAVIETDSSNVAYSRGHLLFLQESTLMAQPFDLERLTRAGDAFPIAEAIQSYARPPAGNFSASAGGVLAYQTGPSPVLPQLAWVDRAGKVLETLGAPGMYGNLELSPDGTRLAVSSSDAITPGSTRESARPAASAAARTNDFWIFDTAIAVPRKLTFDAADEEAAVWSPDGRQIVFNSRRRGQLDLFVKAADGSGTEEEILVDSHDKVPLGWSPEDVLLYFVPAGGRPGDASAGSAFAELWVLPMNGTRKPIRFLPDTSGVIPGARFSPDGQWVAYPALVNGRPEIHVVRYADGSGKQQISTDGGVLPRWSRDGREIFYVALDRRWLKSRSISIQGNALRPLDERALFEIVSSGTARPRSVYDVARDGRLLVYMILPERRPKPPPDPTIVVDWLAMVRRR